jgi:hypothetical protein
MESVVISIQHTQQLFFTRTNGRQLSVYKIGFSTPYIISRVTNELLLPVTQE